MGRQIYKNTFLPALHLIFQNLCGRFCTWTKENMIVLTVCVMEPEVSINLTADGNYFID